MNLFDHLLKRDIPPASARHLGRNEPCWCGSGKKYKRCHFDSDLKHLSRELAVVCRGAT
jgi:uncharacterized protein YecA (UPF0149 family)